MRPIGEISVFHRARNQLGEGVIWMSAIDSILWVDIEGCSLHCKRISDGDLRSWRLARRPTAIAPWRGTRLMLVTETGLSQFDMDQGVERELLSLCDLGGCTRMNDGVVDPSGRFWVGSMSQSGVGQEGKLYCVDVDGNVSVALEGIGISNGIVFADNGQTMYLADSAAGVIYRCRIDPATGEVQEKELFVAADVAAGFPDGAALDNEGYLWSCRWDGWSIARFAPDGTLDRILNLPVQRPTRCAFGSSNNATLYITTARVGLDQETLHGQPLAGCVLAVRPNVWGPESISVAADITKPLCLRENSC